MRTSGQTPAQPHVAKLACNDAPTRAEEPNHDAIRIPGSPTNGATVLTSNPTALISRLQAALARRVRKLGQISDSIALRILPRSGRLTTLYYGLMNGAFDRETRAVLAGRRVFERNRQAPEETSSILRRNTHRLEKGLLMRPRRAVFALDYIEETVNAYVFLADCKNQAETDRSNELKWAHDVLTEYFRVTQAHPKTRSVRQIFTDRQPVESDSPDLAIPYRRGSKSYQLPSFDALYDLAKQRRSVRWFQDLPVDRNLIHRALEVATQAPSACNRQPFFLRLFDDPELIRQVAALPGGTKGFADNFPMVAVVIGELRNYYSERDRHLIYIDSSLAVMGFILALETLGLSSCCINWPDLEDTEEEARKVLRLEPDQRPIMFMAIGHADPTGLVAFSQKKSPRELARFNFE